MDICLAYMPFGLIEPPPLGVSNLVALARESGLSAKAVYPNFRFAEAIGYLTYNALSKGLGGFQICEWIFSAAAFPDFHTDEEDFLSEYLAWERSQGADRYELHFHDESVFRKKCLDIRNQAASFVEDVAQKIMDLKPGIVGCSSSYYQNCASLALLRKLKEWEPGLITMLGGANCEGDMGMVLKRSFAWVDVVVSGEAEELFVPLCRAVLEKGGRIPAVELPYGVITSENMGPGRSQEQGQPVRSGDSGGTEPPVAMVGDLDDLPVPDFEDYLQERGKFCYQAVLPALSLSIETSRGCWWGQKRQCTFCSVNGTNMRYRVKTAERIRAEVDRLHARYGARDFIATDNILDLPVFKSAFGPLEGREPSPYSFFFELKSGLTERQCKWLAEAGVTRVQPGIESLHDRLLTLLNKGSTAVGNVALLKYAQENGIRVTWMMLVDIPGERDEWYAETAAWLPSIAHLQPPHKVKAINFDRFSQYHLHPEKYGLELVPVRWYSGIYPLAPEDLAELAYRFEKKNDDSGREPGRGKKAIERAVLDWLGLYGGGSGRLPSEAPALVVRDHRDGSVVTDTRPCAVQREIFLEGVPHLVHEACRSPVKPARIRRWIDSRAGGEVEPEAVDAAIEALCDMRLLLGLGGRFLTLALREPLRPFAYPPKYKLPGLQAMIEKTSKSVWEAMEDMEKRIAAHHYAEMLGTVQM